MATKKLKLQVLDNLQELAWAVIVLGLSLYCGIEVYFNGPGNRSEPGDSMEGLVKRFLYWLEDTGHGDLVTGILLGAFGVAALICLFLMIYHLGRLTPKRSVLGRSILAQASPHETFEDLVQAIDADFAMEMKEFGTELAAGTQWLLSQQAMRIAKIDRVFVGERKARKKKQPVLAAADGEGNVMETVFSWDQDRDEAVRYLRSRIPGLYVGSLTELD